MNKPGITIYTAPHCVYCRIAKRFFKTHGFDFEEKDVTKDKVAYKTMVEISHQSGVPVIEIGRHIFVGFHQKEVARFLGAGRTGRKKNGLVYRFLSS